MSAKAALSLLLAVLSAPVAFAREDAVTLSVDPPVPAARTAFSLVVSVDGAERVESVAFPRVENLEVISGPSPQRSIEIANGRTRVTLSLVYRATAAEPGETTIPSFSLVADGRTLRAPPFTFRVREPNAGDPVRDPAILREQLKDVLFVTADVSSSEAYVGEPVVLSIRFWISGVRVNYQGLDSPPISGFLQERLGDDRQGRRSRQGRVFSVVERQTLLVPIEPGKKTIAPAEARLEVHLPGSGRRRDPFADLFGEDPFGDFFGSFPDPLGRGAEAVPLVVRSDPVEVTVKPLPAEGRPADFSGAVGEFDLTARLSHREVAAGDPVTLTIEVRGRGNFRSMGPPAFAGPLDGFKAYDPERREKLDTTAEGLFGTITYTQALVPEKAGSTEVPAVAFSFFDAAAGRYRSLRSGPFPLDVAESKGPSRPILVEPGGAGPGGAPVEILSEDVLPLLPLSSPLARRAPVPFLALALAGAAPLFTLALAAVFAKRRERFRLDPKARRKEEAYRTALTRLREGSGAEAAARAVGGFIADRLALPGASVTPDEVAAHLGPRCDPDLVATAREFLVECDRSRFAPRGVPPAADEVARAEALVRRLREALR